MAFDDAPAYRRFMGRFSEPLAVPFADLVGVGAGQRVLDVGCGPGALTAELARRVGPDRVCAVDPSEPFVAAAREACPGVDIRVARAEALPFGDDEFDRAAAQLVVHFMTDPVAGLAEMGRVTRPGGSVAACVWDHGGGSGPLSTFWRAVHDLDPSAPGEADLPGSREGHLAELCLAAGLLAPDSSSLTVGVPMTGFEDWWEPFTLRVGPASEYVAGLSPDGRAALRARCAELLPSGEFTATATAWTVRAGVPG